MKKCTTSISAIYLLIIHCLIFSQYVLAQSGEDDQPAQRRNAMVVLQIAARGIYSPKVLSAMRSVSRHEFVPQAQEQNAYSDRALPIGHGQTISQPYIVAFMTELLDVDSNDVVFELGTGSGYQSAVLSQIVSKVYTMEIVGPLGVAATERLKRLEYNNVIAKIGDGYHGMPEAGPFDAIIVTAAASHIPPPLIKQLKPGGKMAIPVGNVFLTQNLMLVEKDLDGKITTSNRLPVRFVPLTGGH